MGEENLLPNRQIILKNYFQGCPKETDFELRTTNVSTEIPHGSKGVLLKNLYLACDPYSCHLMRPQGQSRLFTHSFIVPGSVVNGHGVAKVIKSGDEELKEGDYVWGITGWEDFSMPGLAAYVGWNEICCPKKGETVYVSSGAGGVGHLVGQFAKMMGCYVVGSASTNQKVNLLKTELGFDDAFNYKEGDLRSKLNKFYNLKEPQGIHNLFSLIEKRLSLRGFVVADYKHMYPEYAEWAIKKLQEKKLVYVEDVITGLENVVSAFVGIYHGHNIGKRIVVVAED
ncbi:hypothetical protein DH2020_033692 [Rehmannia glutinosa]|uniref:Uncharacterized protein n=1 Tax=Rehmannia glutinosa TaxID=99300 RepID=A0ABR0VBM5_REHGL